MKKIISIAMLFSGLFLSLSFQANANDRIQGCEEAMIVNCEIALLDLLQEESQQLTEEIELNSLTTAVMNHLNTGKKAESFHCSPTSLCCKIKYSN